MSGVIDLGQYLRVLLRWSWLIGLLTLLGALAGLLYASTRPVTYASTATLLVKPPPEGITVNTQGRPGQIDPVAIILGQPPVAVRTLAFINPSIGAIETAVVEQLGRELPEALRGPGALRRRVQVTEVAGRPDVLVATATMENRDLAVRVANLWASRTATYLNTEIAQGYYNPGTAKRVIAEAKRDWNAAQNELNRFERDPRFASVASQLATSERLLEGLSGQSVLIQQNLDNARLLGPSLQGGQGSQSSNLALLLINVQTFAVEEADVHLDRFLPSVERRVEARDGVQDRQQVVTAERASGVEVRPTLEQLEKLTPRQQLALLDGIIGVLRAKQVQLQRDIPALTTQIAGLRARYEELSSQRDELEVNRNAERQLYESLQTTDKQQSVGPRILGDRVTVVGPAVEAQRAGLRGLVLPILGGLAGLLLGTLLASLLQFARRARPADDARPFAVSPQVRR